LKKQSASGQSRNNGLNLLGANNKVYAKTDISNFEQNKKNKMKRPQFLPQMGTQSESRDFKNARLQMYQ